MSYDGGPKMSLGYEINPLILRKLTELETDERVRQFIEEILELERMNLNLKERAYRSDYEKILAKYVRME